MVTQQATTHSPEREHPLHGKAFRSFTITYAIYYILSLATIIGANLLMTGRLRQAADGSILLVTALLLIPLTRTPIGFIKSTLIAVPALIMAFLIQLWIIQPRVTEGIAFWYVPIIIIYFSITHAAAYIAEHITKAREFTLL